MKRSLENGSDSQHGDDILPSSTGEVSTSSGTVDYVPAQHDPLGYVQPTSDSQVAEPNENDQTVISQRPVAAPEEFYRSMPLSELAGMLEGRQLDHFAVEQMIGGGGMGAVFRGRDLRLDRVVAIKVIPASRRDAETLRRFRLEAQAAAKLDHPNIARVYYVGEAEQWNYIVFEFIDGVNIRDLVEMEGPLGVDDAVFYTRQVAEALQHAHERDVVHRDVKPSNVLVTALGSAKVVDMGLARSTALDKSTADATASGVTLGTFDYISPEQARNPRDADVRSDLYSLGCTLFYMLTGHPPFPEGTALQKLLSHGSQPPPDPRGWRDDLSDQLFEIMMKLMAKRPGDRYQKPAELISDLVMLAEVEDLPRSQSPGTLMVSPNIAQRSLVETNLPWIVAFAFLLGSTLWLQSVQTLSNDFTLSELEFKAVREAGPSATAAVAPSTPVAPATNATEAATKPRTAPQLSPSEPPLPELPAVSPDSLPAGDTPPPANAAASLPLLPAGASTLVVSAERPADVDARLWAGSLTAALQQAAVDRNIRDIELHGPQKIEAIAKLQGLDLTIRGVASSSSPAATGSQTKRAAASIQIAEALLSANPEGAAAFDLLDTRLHFEAVAFDISLPPNNPIAKQALFRISGNSQLEMDACTATVRDSTESTKYLMVLCNSSASDSSKRATTRLASTGDTAASATEGQTLTIRAGTSIFRGAASFLGLDAVDNSPSDRLDISFSDTLVCLTGSVLDLKAATGDIKAQRYARLLCSQSTFVTGQAFAKLEYVGNDAPLLGLIRTSQNCIYWSRSEVPHVKISGARRQSLLGNFNLLLLQGMNNLYDANIENVCQCFSGSEQIVTFGFTEAYTSGWLGERGNEARIRWQRTSVPPMPWHAARPRDFRVTDSLFVPGITPENLPDPTSE